MFYMWSCNFKIQWHMSFLIQDCHNLLHARNLHDSCPHHNVTYEIKMRSVGNMWERKHHLHGWTGALAMNEIRVEYSIPHPFAFSAKGKLGRRNFLRGLAGKKFAVAKWARMISMQMKASRRLSKFRRLIL